MRLIRKIFFILLILFFFSSLTKNLLDFGKKLAFYEDFKSSYEKEKKRNSELQTEYLKKKDPNEVEKTIRNKLNLLKPNEVAIILKQPTPIPTILTPTPLPNYQQWWNVFFEQ